MFTIVILWLAVFVFSSNFLLHYLVWALPFFVMAGYLRETVVLQLAVIPVLVITYLSSEPVTRLLADAYVAMMICLSVFGLSLWSRCCAGSSSGGVRIQPAPSRRWWGFRGRSAAACGPRLTRPERAQSCSAIRGASRLNIHTASTQMAM